jgi:predicted DNA-binding protein
MLDRLTSVVFRLNRDRLDSLKDLSKETRVRQSEYLREAINDLLAKYQKVVPVRVQ